MITYKELNNKAKEIEKNTGLQHLEIYQRFMFEKILERISVSKYRNNFILKGGLLLSAIFGIDNRSTRDMDITIKGIDISKEKMIFDDWKEVVQEMMKSYKENKEDHSILEKLMDLINEDKKD